MGISVLETPAEQSLERFNDAANFLRHLNQRWKNRLVLKGKPYWEQYREGRAALILHCEIPEALQSESIGRFGNEHSRPIFTFSVVLKARIEHSHKIDNWDDKLVFVSDVQLVECPQGWIPSLVGLYVIDNEIVNGIVDPEIWTRQ